MLFQEIMRLEPFEGATVLVGDTRGEHQVKAVYVSDVLRINRRQG